MIEGLGFKWLWFSGSGALGLTAFAVVVLPGGLGVLGFLVLPWFAGHRFSVLLGLRRMRSTNPKPPNYSAPKSLKSVNRSQKA